MFVRSAFPEAHAMKKATFDNLEEQRKTKIEERKKELDRSIEENEKERGEGNLKNMKEREEQDEREVDRSRVTSSSSRTFQAWQATKKEVQEDKVQEEEREPRLYPPKIVEKLRRQR